MPNWRKFWKPWRAKQTMPNLEKILEAIGEQNLKLSIEQNDVELLLIKSRDKKIDLVIKDNEQFKKLIKEIRK